MAADALAPFTPRPSAAMVLTISEWTSPCLPLGRISTTCAISVLRNYEKCRYIFFLAKINLVPVGGWSNIKMPSYQYRKSPCGDKMIFWLSYLHNEISCNGKTNSLYWIGSQNSFGCVTMLYYTVVTCMSWHVVTACMFDQHRWVRNQ